MRNTITYILFLILLLNGHITKSQVQEGEIKAVYLIKIINNFDWPDKEKPFVINVISKNNLFYKQLKNYAKDFRIQGRNIEIKHSVRLSNNKESDVVYYGQDKNENLPSDDEFKKNVLIVTNNVEDQSRTMINFHLSYDQKLRFKVNKEFLIRAGFTPSTLLLILGGTDNDILNLFEEKDMSLAQEKTKSLKLKLQNENKTKELSLLQKEYEGISNKLQEQEAQLAQKNSEIIAANRNILEQKDKYSVISGRVKSVKQAYERDIIKLKKQKEKSYKLEEQFQIQNKSIIAQKAKISEQELILKDQNDALKGKEKNLKYAFLFSTALLLVSILALFSYLGKRKSNNILAVKNKKINDALDQLQVTQAKLIQSEKMASLGMFTAGMAHEINNPMTFVFTGASILKAELRDADPEIKETIDDIIMGAQRVSDIIESLQNFSRLDESNVKSINLHQNIESTLLILGSHAREKNVKINKYFDSKTIKIDCFPASLNQVIANIISNAIDATERDQGEINITTSLDKNQCLIEISDNGIGIKQEDIGKIFDPFFTTKEIGKGTGLGLSISYNIIKKHKGNITVVSEIGKGTSFTIEIPSVYIA